MKIAINKNTINAYKKDGNEYIYLFDDEPLQELLKTNLHCINYKYCDFVDINLTDFDIECIKKAKLTDKNYEKLPEKVDYTYTIIVPNYNNDHGNYKGKTFLQNCIESILNQTYQNFYLVIVDDMSTDSSVETIKKYMYDEKYINKIKLIQNTRKRYNGGSRNVGIEYALNYIETDYFCFLDSDDWWKHNKVLELINSRLYDHEMALIGLELIDNNGVFMTKFHEYKNYQDFFLSDNKVWCTAWARVIRKDKIVYFCEDTLMEDRVWSYKQADNVDLDKVINIKEVCYVWNRTNVTNSVSMTRSDFWNASAYCHIGHQLQLLTQLKHKEMIPILKKRIETCKNKVTSGTYQQY